MLSASASQVGVYCMMGSEGSQIYRDQDIRMEIALTLNGTAVLEVENLTDKVMYIDLARSFVWENQLSDNKRGEKRKNRCKSGDLDGNCGMMRTVDCNLSTV